jgi:hypothetical protein
MADDTSDVQPYYEVSELKRQMKKLQERDSVNPDQLLTSMNNVTKGIDSMLQLFKIAVDEMKLEEQEEKTFNTQIQPIVEKLDEIIEQNKIIAEGMVAISDLIKERLPDKKAEPIIEEQKFPKMSPQRMPPMQQQSMPRMPPQGQMGFPPPPGGMPQMPNIPPLMPPPDMQSTMPPSDMPFPPGMEMPPLPPKDAKRPGFFKK